MTRIPLALLLSFPLWAQIHIDAGSATDKNFSGGWAYTYPGSPSSLPTMRYGDFSYSFPVTPGDYTVTLTFIERIVTTARAHVFNVSINGAAVLSNLDLFAVGGSAPVVRTFPVKVTGPLVIGFSTVVRNAIVNVIDVAPVPVIPPSTQPIPLGGSLLSVPAETVCISRTIGLADLRVPAMVAVSPLATLPAGWLMTDVYHMEVQTWAAPNSPRMHLNIGTDAGQGSVLDVVLGAPAGVALGFPSGMAVGGAPVSISAFWTVDAGGTNWDQFVSGKSYIRVCGRHSGSPAISSVPIVGTLRSDGTCGPLRWAASSTAVSPVRVLEPDCWRTDWNRHDSAYDSKCSGNIYVDSSGAGHPAGSVNLLQTFPCVQ